MSDTPPDAADKAAVQFLQGNHVVFHSPKKSKWLHDVLAAIIREHYADLQTERDEAVDRLRDLVREALRYQPGEVNAMLSEVARSNSTYLTRIDAEQEGGGDD